MWYVHFPLFFFQGLSLSYCVKVVPIYIFFFLFTELTLVTTYLIRFIMILFCFRKLMDFFVFICGSKIFKLRLFSLSNSIVGYKAYILRHIHGNYRQYLHLQGHSFRKLKYPKRIENISVIINHY